MLTDFLIFPALFVIYLTANLCLRSLGIDNKIVLLAFVFIFSHLLFTALMYLQTRNSSCEYSEDKTEYSAFSAILTAVSIVISYLVLGVAPFSKILFYPLSFLPYSSIWLDHFIVSLPATGIHVVARYIITNMMNCSR